MTNAVWMWMLSLWMLATAAGIAIYWATWFRTPHEQAWLPVGYHEHERVFVFPDTLLATRSLPRPCSPSPNTTLRPVSAWSQPEC